MEPHILSLPQITSKFCRNTLIEAQPYAPLHPFRSTSSDEYNTQISKNQPNLLSLSLNTPSPPLHRWRSELYASPSYKQTRDKLKQTFTYSLVHPREEVSQPPLHQQLPVPPIRSFSSIRSQEQQYHLAVTPKSVRINLIENSENKCLAQSHSSNNKLNNANFPFLLDESLQPILSHAPPKASRQLTKLRLFSMSIPDAQGVISTHPSYLFPRFNRPSLQVHRYKVQEHGSCHVSNIELEMMDAPHPKTFPNLYVSCWNNRLVCLHGRRKPTDITKNELYLIGHSNFANHSLLSLSMPCLSPSKPVDPYSSFRTLAPSAYSNLDQLYTRAPNNSGYENYSPPPHSSPGSDQFVFTRADSYKSTPVPPSPILWNSRTDYDIIQSPPSKSTCYVKKSPSNSSSFQIPRSPSNSSSFQIPRPSNSSSFQRPRSPNSSSFQIPRSPNSSSFQIPRSPNSSSFQRPRSPNSSSFQIPRSISNSSSFQIPRSPNSSSFQRPRSPNSSSFQIPRSLSNSSSFQILRSPSNSNPFPLQKSPNGMSHSIIKSSATEFHSNNTPLIQSHPSNINPFSNDASYTQNSPSTDVINTPSILQSSSDINQISIIDQPISPQSQKLNLNPLVQVSDTPFSRDLRGEENDSLNEIMNYQERDLNYLTDKQTLPPISRRKDKRNLVFKEVPVKWRVSANPHFENKDTSLLNKEVIHSKVSQSLRGSPFTHSEDKDDGRVVGSSHCSSSSGDSDSGNPITPSFIDNFIDELVFGIDFYNKMATRGESRECSASRNNSKRRDHPSSRSRERERGSRHLHRHLASSYGVRMNRIREQRRTNLKIQLSMKQMEKLKQRRKKLSGDGLENLFNITRAYTYSYFRSGCRNGTACSTQNSDVDDDSSFS